MGNFIYDRVIMITISSLFVRSVFLVCVSCAASNTPVPRTASNRSPLPPIARYFPKEDNMVYAYKAVDFVAGTSGVLILRVRRRGDEGVELIGGAQPQRISFRSDGILRDNDGTYVLRSPLETGKSWPGGPGATRRIRATNATVQVPAGVFSHCLEVVEERTGSIQGNIITTFCADVGIVKMESNGVSDNGTVIHEQLELRSFAVAIDLSKGARVPASVTK